MQTTRRGFLGAMSAAAAIGVAGETTRSAERHAAILPGVPTAKAPQEKQLFWVAASTPCDKSLSFDPELYADLLAYLKEKGADGVVVLGTTGEFPSFSTAERKKIAEVAFKHRNGLNIIVSPGTANFPETLELSLHAQDNGADGLLIVPPFYYKHPHPDGLTRYFSILFDKVNIPINLYHIPFATGIPISLDLMHSLERYPNLAGIKDSSSDEEDYHKFVAEFPNLNMRTGTTHNLKYAMDNGMGAILAEGNNFTEQIAAVFLAKRNSRDINPPLAKLDGALKLLRAGGVDDYGPMKYALSLQMSTRQFYQRPPNSDVTDEQKTTIREALDEIKKLG
jgi:4-hydroxy-tetrahydrodipicolinate synthase